MDGRTDKTGRQSRFQSGILRLGWLLGLALSPLVLGGVTAGGEETPPVLGESSVAEGRDIVSLYDQAVRRTEEVCEDYRRIRAMQLARARNLPYDEAYRNIQSVMPELRAIDRDILTRGIWHPDDVAPHKQELNRVKAEVEEMIELVRRLLLEIERVAQQMQTPPPPMETTLEDVLEREEFDPEQELQTEMAEQTSEAQTEQQALMAEQVELAREDEEERARDLTPVMRQLMDALDLTGDSTAATFVASNDLGRLGSLRRNMDNAIFARKIGQGGEPREWLFIDTWYTIGPFPNPERTYLNRQFPPETVIDLDAVYPGKGGRLVKWEWIQSRDLFVVPAFPEEYGIWYAYTEIHLDQPMDLWVALGSDDKGDVWVNEIPIWISGGQLKPWRMDEGFRKVHFREGINRILYRNENGWLGMGFSMAIRVAE